MTKRKGFTLIELLITISIIGILFVILFRSYNTISQVTFRIQQEKTLQEEIIWIGQTLQNIADNYTLDVENQQNNHEIVFLSGNKGKIKITYTGLCKNDTTEINEFTKEEIENPCRLLLIDNNNNNITINNPKTSIFSHIYFTTFPKEPNKNDKTKTNETFPFLKIQQPGFQIITTIYTPIYQKNNRTKSSSTIFQQFFNLQK